jgi:hypothetical protein
MLTTLPLERELKNHLVKNNIKFEDNSKSYKLLDFTLFLEKKFHLDVKEKLQKYSMDNWPKSVPERDMFIVDDLAVRKCLAYSPLSGLLIRDKLTSRYVFFPIIDLALMPKKRVYREIKRNQPDIKGKWIVNLKNGKIFDALDDAVAYIPVFISEISNILFENHGCYGNFVDEKIEKGGITRAPSHWDTDVHSTR